MEATTRTQDHAPIIRQTRVIGAWPALYTLMSGNPLGLFGKSLDDILLSLRNAQSRAPTTPPNTPSNGWKTTPPSRVNKETRAATRVTLSLASGGRTQLRSGAAPVAQGIEHRFPKPCVVGSNPTGGAKKDPVTRPNAESAKSQMTATPV
jgi:hypothetical protein